METEITGTEEFEEQETEQPVEEETQQEVEGVPDPGEQEQESVQETTESPDYMYIQSEQIELTNHLLAGQIFFLGTIFGVLLFKIFWDRWKI